MPINRKKASNYLKQLDFQSLFIEELLWDRASSQEILLTIDGQDFLLKQIAQKRGMMVYGCNSVPDYATRTKIDKEALKYSREHFIVYYDLNQQIWQWVKREQGKPIARREQKVYANQSGEALLQKLDAIAISFEEEEKITLVDVTSRASKVFDVDKVTKKFYERFKKVHEDFLKRIAGIQSQFDQEWYASLMLNRLMFIYFMQKKHFLDGNINYLQERLALCQKEYGNDQFYSFYRYFLLRLFHDGLGKQARTPELDKLLGKIPYLNGGLFEEHPLEQANTDIQIPDIAFTAIFNFFDQYDWHLDDRPLRSDKEINPDVLGYIFEKYINQKQMGAYYTKEDITEYISKNCIIPYLFDATQKESDGALWRLLRDSPDLYIYEAVRKGVDIPLPDDIEAGISDVSKRTNWNKSASADYALPTETWREHVARRTRCLDLREKLSKSEITKINDLITYNLDIRQFAQDAIGSCESADFLLAFYRAIEKISILDPTCGSGAFLFAALNILEPIYDACLDRMQGFIDDCDRSDDPKAAQRHQEFRQILENVGKHNNRRYFILKSIIINNLYGVDIMEEATEICKLRLFLKLVSQVEADPKKPNYGIEPLPDIDFNIRAGNTLVGFATLEEVRKAVNTESSGQGKLIFDDTLERIEKSAVAVDQIFQEFRSLQSVDNADSKQLVTKKNELRSSLGKLNDELDRYLADEYKKGQSKKPELFQKWKSSHQPFHWFVEFYGIVSQDGFDVIIGNPPYVELKKLTYVLKGYATEKSGNLYAPVIERCFSLTNKKGKSGMIIPHSAICTDRMECLINLFANINIWLSSYDVRPSKLFDDVDQRLLIYITAFSNKNLFTSKYHRWASGYRPFLFSILQYVSLETNNIVPNSIAKVCSEVELRILEKITSNSPLSLQQQLSLPKIFFHNAPRYFIRVMDTVPYFWNEREGEKISTQIKSLSFGNSHKTRIAGSVLNSNLFYWWFIAFSDSRHLNNREIDFFPLTIENISKQIAQQLVDLFEILNRDFEENKYRKEAYYKATGNVIYDEYYPKKSKPIIDEIDRILAQHYGFSPEELDFIINYDIKYRMGKDDGGED
ncbi:Eco57I restriction-modification methylase domain-containing protein [Prochlorothrix hollandica]|uniref:Eco57I restriction-modification methylase domain-containing protein n=1 Tax=Prochlorothrix hollandica TaxID=1223 RepID=UPI00034D5A5C|nr:DNA methyltransferase [Prochlorothrix hollandica]